MSTNEAALTARIAELESQVDTLQRVLNTRNHRVKELESENRRLLFYSKAVSKGASAAFTTSLTELADLYEKKIADMQTENEEMAAKLIPSRLMDSSPREGCTRVGVSIMVVQPPKDASGNEIITYRLRGDVVGGASEITDYLIDSISLTLTGIPTYEDFARRNSAHRYLKGVTVREIMPIFHELSYLRSDRAKYLKMRVELEKQLYAKLDSPDYEYTWQEFNDWFNKFIDDTFDTIDSFRQRVTSESFKQFTHF